MILTAEELRELTGKRRPAWQARELDFLGIPYRRRSDGSLIVLRCHIDGAHHQVTRQPQVQPA